MTVVSFSIDKCCGVGNNQNFHVFPAKSVVENAHMEGGGIDLTRGTLWDHRSANARAVLGFMESHWQMMHPKKVSEFHAMPHSKCAEQVFLHSLCVACAPVIIEQGLLRLQHTTKRDMHASTLMVATRCHAH